jgi:hypothetical protein
MTTSSQLTEDFYARTEAFPEHCPDRPVAPLQLLNAVANSTPAFIKTLSGDLLTPCDIIFSKDDLVRPAACCIFSAPSAASLRLPGSETKEKDSNASFLLVFAPGTRFADVGKTASSAELVKIAEEILCVSHLKHFLMKYSASNRVEFEVELTEPEKKFTLVFPDLESIVLFQRLAFGLLKAKISSRNEMRQVSLFLIHFNLYSRMSRPPEAGCTPASFETAELTAEASNIEWMVLLNNSKENFSMENE